MSGGQTRRAQQPQQTPQQAQDQRDQRTFDRNCSSPAPTNLDTRPFLGKGFTQSDGVSAEGRVGRFGGVNATLRGRLDAVEAELNTRWGQTPEDQRLKPDGSRARTVADWCGVQGNHIGWRPDRSGHHRSGSAIDIDAGANPYVAIRQTSTAADGTTSETMGGEEAGRINRQARGGRGVTDAQQDAAQDVNAQRSQAVAVYDRARTFAGQQGQANVAPRSGSETTGAQYDRMRAASDHLSQYLGLVFRTAPGSVSRRPVADPQNAARDVLIAEVTEANPQAAAVAAIQAHLTAHPNPAWTLSADETYVQILRDYESVRIPMQHGAVTTTPGRTRNPAAGFLQFTRSFTEVMAGTGRLRWGGTAMGMESGDMMHFDLGGDAEAVPAGVCAAGRQTDAAPTSGGG
jgi:hypothetical protein